LGTQGGGLRQTPKLLSIATRRILADSESQASNLAGFAKRYRQNLHLKYLGIQEQFGIDSLKSNEL
jgi:hypothetical protein